jgi:hypothetical protein
MKTKIFFLTLAFLSFLNVNAKTWRINNDPTKDPDFTSLQACNDNPSVLNGDFVHLEPSSIPYSAAIVTKAIYIIGNGYFLAGAGSNSGLQANTLTSTILGISFNTGAAGTPSSGSGFGTGARVGGCVINSINLNGVANVNVVKCLIGSISFNGYNAIANFLKFSKNFITGTVNSTGFTGSPSVDVIFENNIFSSETGFSTTISFILDPTMKGLFRNNVWNVANANVALSNFYTTNNIFPQANAGFANTNLNNVYKNNLFVTTTPGTGIINNVGGNKTGVVANTIFGTNFATGTGDARFQILTVNTNPALDGGETIGAVISPDCGAFGTPDRYVLSGIPTRPTIYNITAPIGIAVGASTMQISISTRVNGANSNNIAF